MSDSETKYRATAALRAGDELERRHNERLNMVEIAKVILKHRDAEGGSPAQPGREDGTGDASASAVSELSAKIDRLSDLKPNWDTYNGEPPNKLAVARARQALGIAADEQFLPDRIVADAEGGIALVYFRDERFGSVCFYNDGTVEVTSRRTRAEGYRAKDVERSDSWPSAMQRSLQDIRAFLSEEPSS